MKLHYSFVYTLYMQIYDVKEEGTGRFIRCLCSVKYTRLSAIPSIINRHSRGILIVPSFVGLGENSLKLFLSQNPVWKIIIWRKYSKHGVYVSGSVPRPPLPRPWLPHYILSSVFYVLKPRIPNMCLLVSLCVRLLMFSEEWLPGFFQNVDTFLLRHNCIAYLTVFFIVSAHVSCIILYVESRELVNGWAWISFLGSGHAVVFEVQRWNKIMYVLHLTQQYIYFINAINTKYKKNYYWEVLIKYFGLFQFCLKSNQNNWHFM